LKLYYIPGACSLASHIAANEAGLAIEFVKVENSDQGKRAGGASYLDVNPRGTVPTLQLDDGSILTEGAVILQYLAALAPTSGLAPAGGGMAHWRLLELLNFIATELHKNFGPLFNPATPDALRATYTANLIARFKVMDEKLKGNPYLTGEKFTVADAYLYGILLWANFIKLDLADCTALNAFQSLVTARPAVKKTLKEEGLPGGE
jgi:glutathione S-transferase